METPPSQDKEEAAVGFFIFYFYFFSGDVEKDEKGIIALFKRSSLP